MTKAMTKPSNHKKFIKTACLSGVLALSACGGGGGSNSEPADAQAGSSTTNLVDELEGKNITRVGVFQYQKKEGNFNGQGNPVQSNIGARFYSYENALSLNTLQKLAEEYSTNTEEFCNVFWNRGWSDISDDPHPIQLESYRRISAGEILPVMAPQGTIAELEAYAPAGYDWVVYDLKASPNVYDLEQHLPNDSFVSIPGDEYPEIGRIDIPNIGMVSGTDVQNTTTSARWSSEVFTDDSVITWDSSNDSNSYVWLNVYAIENVYDGGPTRFYCNVKDDGEFTIPQNLRDAFQENEFPVEEMSIWRERFNFTLQDDTLMVIKATTRSASDPDFLMIGPTLWD